MRMPLADRRPRCSGGDDWLRPMRRSVATEMHGFYFRENSENIKSSSQRITIIVEGLLSTTIVFCSPAALLFSPHEREFFASWLHAREKEDFSIQKVYHIRGNS
jgi:hypothetical protein